MPVAPLDAPGDSTHAIASADTTPISTPRTTSQAQTTRLIKPASCEAWCVCYIIPEALEVSMIARVASDLSPSRLISTRPYCASHHGALRVTPVTGDEIPG